MCEKVLCILFKGFSAKDIVCFLVRYYDKYFRKSDKIVQLLSLQFVQKEISPRDTLWAHYFLGKSYRVFIQVMKMVHECTDNAVQFCDEKELRSLIQLENLKNGGTLLGKILLVFGIWWTW